MRKILPAICALVVAACDAGPSATGPTEAHVVPIAATNRTLVIAVDDAIDRLLPGLATDAYGPVGTSLRELRARLHAPTPNASAIREALAVARKTLNELRGPGRTDAATLDALRLELDVQ